MRKEGLSADALRESGSSFHVHGDSGPRSFGYADANALTDRAPPDPVLPLDRAPGHARPGIPSCTLLIFGSVIPVQVRGGTRPAQDEVSELSKLPVRVGGTEAFLDVEQRGKLAGVGRCRGV